MPNPARPVTGTPIDTAWGLAVADTVVRTYPNAATRDADLGSFTSADLLGQVVLLTDTGALQVYAGPVMGWRPPWSLPWGQVAGTVSSLDVTGSASSQTILSSIPSVTLVAGRNYRASGVGTILATGGGQLNVVIGGTTYTGRVPASAGGEISLAVLTTFAQASTLATTLDLRMTGAALTAKGTLTPHRIVLEDVGPSANPTALVMARDGQTLEVDVDLLDPEYLPLWDQGVA